MLNRRFYSVLLFAARRYLSSAAQDSQTRPRFDEAIGPKPMTKQSGVFWLE